MNKCRWVLSSIQSKCLYHNKSGEVFDADSLAPDGMCGRAFYSSYTFYLGMLYDAWGDKAKSGIAFKCSCADGDSEWSIDIRRKSYAPVVRIAELALRLLGRYLDFPERDIRYTLLNASSACGIKNQNKKIFISSPSKSLISKGRFCPQSFYCSYPYIDRTDGRLSPPWGEGVSCPANAQRAVYKTECSGG